MIRLNITVPEDVAEQLHDIPNKSQFIAQAVKEKFDREKKQKLEKALIEGYKETAAEDRQISRDWDSAALKGWK